MGCWGCWFWYVRNCCGFCDGCGWWGGLVGNRECWSLLWWFVVGVGLCCWRYCGVLGCCFLSEGIVCINWWSVLVVVLFLLGICGCVLGVCVGWLDVIVCWFVLLVIVLFVFWCFGRFVGVWLVVYRWWWFLDCCVWCSVVVVCCFCVVLGLVVGVCYVWYVICGGSW